MKKKKISEIISSINKYSVFLQGVIAILGVIAVLLGAKWTTDATYEAIKISIDASEKAERTSLQIAKIGLMRDLIKEYNLHPEYKHIYSALIECSELVPLTRQETNSKGYLSWQDLNNFLNFLDDVGFFWQSDAIDLKMVDQLFGGLIIEIFLHQDIKKYISQLRSDAGEQEAFNNFEKISKVLILEKKHRKHVQAYQHLSCRK